MQLFRRLLDVYNDQVRWKSENDEVRRLVVQEVDDRTAELLRSMGRILGFKLDNLDLLRGGYYPEAFSTLEQQQLEIRDFLIGLNRADRMLPVAVVDYRHSQKILEEARNAQTILSHAQQLESQPESRREE